MTRRIHLMAATLVLALAACADPSPRAIDALTEPLTVATKILPDTLQLSDGERCAVPVPTYRTITVGETFTCRTFRNPNP